MSQLKHIATFWSLVQYPSPSKEWTVEQKIADAKQAGFDGVAAGAMPELPPVLKKYGMLVTGYISSGKPAEFATAIQAMPGTEAIATLWYGERSVRWIPEGRSSS